MSRLTRIHLCQEDEDLRRLSTLMIQMIFFVVAGCLPSESQRYLSENRLADGRLPGEEQTIQRWFDTSAFGAAQQFNFGNAGWNILYSPGAVNVDGSWFKRFRTNLNTPQGYPDVRVDLPLQGGRITSRRSNMRDFQFGAKGFLHQDAESGQPGGRVNGVHPPTMRRRPSVHRLAPHF